MEEAIEHFLSRLEKQEERGFRDLHRLLSELPLPQPAAGRSLSVSEAIEAGFLPEQDEDVVDMFELRLYRHAQDHRYAFLRISHVIPLQFQISHVILFFIEYMLVY